MAFNKLKAHPNAQSIIVARVKEFLCQPFLPTCDVHWYIFCHSLYLLVLSLSYHTTCSFTFTDFLPPFFKVYHLKILSRVRLSTSQSQNSISACALHSTVRFAAPDLDGGGLGPRRGGRPHTIFR